MSKCQPLSKSAKPDISLLRGAIRQACPTATPEGVDRLVDALFSEHGEKFLRASAEAAFMTGTRAAQAEIDRLRETVRTLESRIAEMERENSELEREIASWISPFARRT